MKQIKNKISFIVRLFSLLFGAWIALQQINVFFNCDALSMIDFAKKTISMIIHYDNNLSGLKFICLNFIYYMLAILYYALLFFSVELTTLFLCEKWTDEKVVTV